MTEQDQRIALAKWDGWNVVHSYGHSEFANSDSEVWHLRKGAELQSAFAWNNFKGKIGNPILNNCISSLPDYPNDLNAVHELEKKLIGDNTNLLHRYCVELNKVVRVETIHAPYNWAFVHATAPQRCEALLQTLGLWKEEL